MDKNNYEIIIIVDGNLTDEEAEQIFAKFKGIINDNGGEVKFESHWGRRRLAYQIKKIKYGVYRLFYFTGDGQVSNELKRQLAYDEKTLKYFIAAVKDLEKAYNSFESLKENPLKNVNVVSEVMGV